LVNWGQFVHLPRVLLVTFSSQTKYMYIAIFTPLSMWIWGRCGGDRMVVGFTTTSAISAYHNWCEFESRSGRGVQHYVIKFVSDLQQVGGFLMRFRFMVFNTTFNNISAISSRSVLLVEETRGPRENHRPVASHWQTLSHNVVHLALIEIRTHISCDRH
jgi:hypothetical protein